MALTSLHLLKHRTNSSQVLPRWLGSLTSELCWLFHSKGQAGKHKPVGLCQHKWLLSAPFFWKQTLTGEGAGREVLAQAGNLPEDLRESREKEICLSTMGLQLFTENSKINILLTSWGKSIVFSVSQLPPRPQYQQNPTKVLLNK